MRSNYKLPQFVLPVLDSLACAVDAFSLPSEDLDPYASPPVTILSKVVAKIKDYPCKRHPVYFKVAQHALDLGTGGDVKTNLTVPAKPADSFFN